MCIYLMLNLIPAHKLLFLVEYLFLPCNLLSGLGTFRFSSVRRPFLSPTCPRGGGPRGGAPGRRLPSRLSREEPEHQELEGSASFLPPPGGVAARGGARGGTGRLWSRLLHARSRRRGRAGPAGWGPGGGAGGAGPQGAGQPAHSAGAAAAAVRAFKVSPLPQ